MTKPIAVRFAPSPTGPLHIGGVRTALYNHLFTQRFGGRCILRIEDTDQTRFVEGAEEYIKEALAWMGIQFTEGPGIGGDFGPYRQSERSAQGLYAKYAQQLIDNGAAYYAFDTSEELEAMRERLKAEGSSIQQYNYATRGSMSNSLTLSAEEVQSRIEAGDPYVVRMKMPEDERIVFQDIVRGEVGFHSAQLDDKVLVKSDGLPTYHLANVVDDYHMQISHVIRGEEWLSSTPLHVMLYRGFGWEEEMPQFVHLPLILNPNGKGKMSKRQGDKMGFSVFPTQWQDPETGNISTGYREDGYEPEALMNFLALLGWNPGNDEELMPEARLVELFDLARINNSGTKFDLDKLKWFNQSYLKGILDKDTLLERVKGELAKAGLSASSDAYLWQAIELMRERVVLRKDFVEQAAFLFTAPTVYDEKMSRKRWKEDSGAILQGLMQAFEELPEWEAGALHERFQAYLATHELGMGKVMAPLRLALTGLPSGPGVFDIAALIGREACQNRVAQAIARLG
ncbi:MAG: glutamate--tRNA ligase [Bacteroidota bacterium]